MNTISKVIRIGKGIYEFIQEDKAIKKELEKNGLESFLKKTDLDANKIHRLVHSS